MEKMITDSGGNEGCVDTPRQLYVVRHGERIDFTFGSGWIKECFNSEGKYLRKDLNMPEVVPARAPDDFYVDAPLTQVGILQASLVGKAMLEANLQFSDVFCSPSLRCVETCTQILKAAGIVESHRINIEPGLFEWLAWLPSGFPKWMSPIKMKELGHNINLKYSPQVSVEVMANTEESCEQFYMRNYLITEKALKSTEISGGNVLFVGHAATLDTCTRQLTGKPPMSSHDLESTVRKIPYCSVIKAFKVGGTWSIAAPPFPTMTNSRNASFDYKVLKNL